MKRLLCLALALMAIGGYAASQGWAKGGGHGGGGQHGGGHHSSHHAHHHSHHGHHSHHHVAHHGHHHAFSHDWHHDHHGAWGWGGGGYAWGNPWAATTYGAAATWLGMSALDNGGGNVTINNNASEVAANTANDEAAAEESKTQPEDAAELAATGATAQDPQAAFLPLGVFSVAPKGKKEAAALVHLAVSKDGLVRGTYYNLKTDKDENIEGAVNKEDGSMAWTVQGKKEEVFHAWLDDVTDPPGPVTVRIGKGPTHVWTMARYTEKDEQRSLKESKRSEAKPSVEKNGLSQ